MNALLTHKWGISPAQDRVWAQVAGLRAAEAVRRVFLVLEFQAFMDESQSGPRIADGEFVLAGHIAPAEKWAALVKEWEALLPGALQDDDGVYYFKMTQMARSPERMARVQKFYELIEKYVTVSISLRINLTDFENALARLEQFSLQHNFHIDLSDWKNPYYYAFRALMDGFHARRYMAEADIPLTETVDFYFDERLQKRIVYQVWDDVLSGLPPEIRKLYGITPRFEDEKKFKSLQTADLWAWYVRRWYEEDAIDVPDKMAALDFGSWRGKRRPCHILSASEDQIYTRFQELLFANVHTITRDGKLMFPDGA